MLVWLAATILLTRGNVVIELFDAGLIVPLISGNKVCELIDVWFA